MPSTEIPGTGIYEDIHEDIYRNFNAVSYSDLKSWIEPFKGATNRMKIGKALHALILEPEAAPKLFWTAPKNLNRTKKADKELFAKWEEDHPHQTVLLPREREEVKLLMQAVKGHDLAMKIIKAPGPNEVSIITQLPGHKLLSKCRIDMLRKGCMADLKTTGATGPEEFEQSINKFAYDGQCAYYPDQYCSITNEFFPWLWICVSTRNFSCWVTRAQPHHYASGHRWYNDILTLKERYDA